MLADIVVFGKLICPNYDKAWNTKEVGFHTGTTDYWVSLRGNVYDLTKFYKLQYVASLFIGAPLEAHTNHSQTQRHHREPCHDGRHDASGTALLEASVLTLVYRVLAGLDLEGYFPMCVHVSIALFRLELTNSLTAPSRLRAQTWSPTRLLRCSSW